MKCVLSSRFKRDFKSFYRDILLPITIIAGVFFVTLPLIWFVFGYIAGNVFNFWCEVYAESPFQYYINSGLPIFMYTFLGVIVLIILLAFLTKIVVMLKNCKNTFNYIFDCKENK